MAFGIPQEPRKQVMLVLIMVAVAVGYGAWGGFGVWDGAHKSMSEKITAARDSIASLQAVVDKAKADLASGTVEDLRRKVEQYRVAVGLMRRLVPEKNEVPALIDDISTKAKVRGITIGKIQPFGVEPGSPFDTYRYRVEVYGHYDQLGEFLADVASLPRIVVPQDVKIVLAGQQAQKVLSDTLGALLEADLSLRTFVKAAAPPPGAKPAAGKPAAAGAAGARR